MLEMEKNQGEFLYKLGFFRNIPEMRKKNITEISRFRTVDRMPRSYRMK